MFDSKLLYTFQPRQIETERRQGKRTQTAHQSRPKLDMCWKCQERIWCASRTLTTFGYIWDIWRPLRSPKRESTKTEMILKDCKLQDVGVEQTKAGFWFMLVPSIRSLGHFIIAGTLESEDKLKPCQVSQSMTSQLKHRSDVGLALGPSRKNLSKKWTLTSGCPDRNYR